MMVHFLEQVYLAKKLKGKAKAMIVSRNIETAIRYYFAIREILQRENAPFKAIVAFSGKKTIDLLPTNSARFSISPPRDSPPS